MERDIPDPDPEVHWGARRVEAVREAKAEDAVAAAWAKKKKKKDKCVTFESKQSTNYDTPSEVTFKTFRQTSSVDKGENAK